MEYRVTLDVVIKDKELLLKAAYARMVTWENDLDVIDQTLYDDEGDVNIEGCLLTLMDPGQTVPGVEVVEGCAEFVWKLAGM